MLPGRSVARARAVAGGLLLWAVFGHAAFAEPIVLSDDRGVQLSLPHPAQRLVAAAPNLAELVAAAGAASRLVGVVRFSDYPPRLARLPQVGDASGLDIEGILALRPDLVLAWKSGNRPADIARLESLGLKVFVSEPAVLEDVARVLRDIGVMAGTESAAQQAAHEFEQKLARLARPDPGSRAVRVFVQIWDQPLMTVNGQHLISDVLRRCGGSNVFADLRSLAGPVSIEAVLAADPQVIIATGVPQRFDPARYWARAPGLVAVSAGRVYLLHPDWITRATPRVLVGMRAVCDWLDGSKPGALPTVEDGASGDPGR